MDAQIRKVRHNDLEAALALNESVVPHVNSISLQKMSWFAEHADYFRVVDGGSDIAGLLIGFRPGSAYDSPYYRWFCDNFDDFAYVDRVAIANTARRRGLASRLYRDFESHFQGQVPRLACEVNLLPANDTSIAFHQRLGFDTVEEAVIEPGKRAVARLVKPLNKQDGRDRSSPTTRT